MTDKSTSEAFGMTVVPLISVVIPCYNQAHYLRKCLDSIQIQSLDAWEVLVVDDASPDSDAMSEVVQALDDSRIRLIHHAENRGLAASRNTGVRAAAADVIAFVDSDDYLHVNFLKQSLEQIHTGYDVVYAFFQRFGDEQSVRIKDDTSENAMYSALRYWIPGPGTVIRRTVWEQVGGYCEADALRVGMEDREFWIATIPLGLRIGVIREPLYFYRRHAISMSRKLAPHYYRTHRYIVHRRKPVFDALKLGSAFIGEGYFLSGRAAYANGQRWKAVRLLTTGLLYSPGHRKLQQYWLRACFANVARPLRSVLRKLNLTLQTLSRKNGVA